MDHIRIHNMSSNKDQSENTKQHQSIKQNREQFINALKEGSKEKIKETGKIDEWN